MLLPTGGETGAGYELLPSLEHLAKHKLRDVSFYFALK